MNIEVAKWNILEEAARHSNQIFKVATGDGYYVKGYCSPDELRCIYIAALDSLLQHGLIKHVFTNKDFELYAVNACATELTTMHSATERILAELDATGSVYKIHSHQGEFVQCGDNAFDQFEHERIVFMRALHVLLHSGKIRVVSESREMCRLELAPINTRSQVPQAIANSR